MCAGHRDLSRAAPPAGPLPFHFRRAAHNGMNGVISAWAARFIEELGQRWGRGSQGGRGAVLCIRVSGWLSVWLSVYVCVPLRGWGAQPWSLAQSGVHRFLCGCACRLGVSECRSGSLQVCGSRPTAALRLRAGGHQPNPLRGVDGPQLLPPEFPAGPYGVLGVHHPPRAVLVHRGGGAWGAALYVQYRLSFKVRPAPPGGGGACLSQALQSTRI